MKLPFKKTAPASVDGIMSAFTNTISELRNLAYEKEVETNELEDQIENLKDDARKAEAEADRASVLADRLSDLVEVA